jgi:hypothetical protein
MMEAAMDCTRIWSSLRIDLCVGLDQVCPSRFARQYASFFTARSNSESALEVPRL